MKLKEMIVIAKLAPKLIQTSFDTAQKNYNVMKFCKYAENEAQFYHNERQKLFEELGYEKDDGTLQIKPGHIDEFTKKANEIIELDIENPAMLNITMEDLQECKYSKDNEMWLNAMDMLVIESFLDTQGKQSIKE